MTPAMNVVAQGTRQSMTMNMSVAGNATGRGTPMKTVSELYLVGISGLFTGLVFTTNNAERRVINLSRLVFSLMFVASLVVAR